MFFFVFFFFKDFSDRDSLHVKTSSEVGGVRTKWPQPGNRFVSFVRAGGRAARARSVAVT